MESVWHGLDINETNNKEKKTEGKGTNRKEQMGSVKQTIKHGSSDGPCLQVLCVQHSPGISSYKNKRFGRSRKDLLVREQIDSRLLDGVSREIELLAPIYMVEEEKEGGSGGRPSAHKYKRKVGCNEMMDGLDLSKPSNKEKASHRGSTIPPPRSHSHCSFFFFKEAPLT
jgi:hypothetical protein